MKARLFTQKGFMIVMVVVVTTLLITLGLTCNAQSNKGYLFVGGGINSEVDGKITNVAHPISEISIGLKLGKSKSFGVGLVGEVSKSPTINLGITTFSETKSSPIIDINAGALLYNDEVLKGLWNMKMALGFIMPPNQFRAYFKVGYQQKTFSYNPQSSLSGKQSFNYIFALVGIKF